jgi:hypothetical protein
VWLHQAVNQPADKLTQRLVWCVAAGATGNCLDVPLVFMLWLLLAVCVGQDSAHHWWHHLFGLGGPSRGGAAWLSWIADK